MQLPCRFGLLEDRGWQRSHGSKITSPPSSERNDMLNFDGWLPFFQVRSLLCTGHIALCAQSALFLLHFHAHRVYSWHEALVKAGDRVRIIPSPALLASTTPLCREEDQVIFSGKVSAMRPARCLHSALRYATSSGAIVPERITSAGWPLKCLCSTLWSPVKCSHSESTRRRSRHSTAAV